MELHQEKKIRKKGHQFHSEGWLRSKNGKNSSKYQEKQHRT